MAYQAKRKQQYTEEFQLVNEYGAVAHTLYVCLDAETMVKQLSEKHIALIKVAKEAQSMIAIGVDESNAKDALELYGKAIVNLIEGCFGAQDSSIILEFYDNRYMEMYEEVVPFITQTVIPELRKIASNNKKNVLANYNRKQRRGFMRRNK